MYCSSCGAKISKPDQVYCQACGATIPMAKGNTSMVRRQSDSVSGRATGGMFSLLPVNTRDRLLLGAGGGVAAVVVLWIILNAIVHALIALIPIFVVLGILYLGFRYLRAKVL